MEFRSSRAAFLVLFIFVLFVATRGFPAQSPFDPNQVINEVNQFTKDLGPNLKNDAARLNNLAKKQLKEIKSQYKRARDQVDSASDAAMEAFLKAKQMAGKPDCDPKEFERLRTRAEKRMTRSISRFSGRSSACGFSGRSTPASSSSRCVPPDWA